MFANSSIIKEQVKKAAIWGYIGLFARFTIQLGSQVLLARLVGPIEYGAFAIGAIIVGVANFIADGGIGAAIVQRISITNDEIKFIHTWQIVTGIFTFALIWLISPALTQFFNADKQTTEVIRMMGAVCLLTSFGSVSQNILRRNLDFRQIQITQLTGMVFGYICVGLPLAYIGSGVWSLGFAWVAQSVVTTLLLYFYATPPLGIKFWCSGGKEIAFFGISALVSNLSTWLSSGIDKIIVGSRYTPTQLSTYNVAVNLIYTATSQILSTAQQLIFSVTAKDVERQSESLRNVASLLIEVGVLIFFPVMISISITSETIVLTLYGEKWIDAAAVLSPAALTMAFYGVSGLLTPLLWSTGSISSDAKVQFGSVFLIFVVGSIAATQNAPSVVAWAVLPCVVLKSIWVVRTVSNKMRLNLQKIARSLLSGSAASIGIVIFLTGSIWLFEAAEIAKNYRIFGLIIVYLTIYPIVIGFSINFAGTRELKILVNPIIEKFSPHLKAT